MAISEIVRRSTCSPNKLEGRPLHRDIKQQSEGRDDATNGEDQQQRRNARDQGHHRHAAAAAGEDEGDEIIGDLVSLGRNAPSVEGDNRKGREKSKHLNVDKH